MTVVQYSSSTNIRMVYGQVYFAQTITFQRHKRLGWKATGKERHRSWRKFAIRAHRTVNSWTYKRVLKKKKTDTQSQMVWEPDVALILPYRGSRWNSSASPSSYRAPSITVHIQSKFIKSSEFFPRNSLKDAYFLYVSLMLSGTFSMFINSALVYFETLVWWNMLDARVFCVNHE